MTKSSPSEFRPEVEAIGEYLEELTSYQVETLLLQTLVANHPDVVDNFLSTRTVDHNSSTSETDKSLTDSIVARLQGLPMWFALDPTSREYFDRVRDKYKDRIDQEQLLQYLLVLGMQHLDG